MERLTTTLITLFLVSFLLGACVPLAAPSPAPVESPVAAQATVGTLPNVTASPTAGAPALPGGGWYYSNAGVGFSIEVPPIWSRHTLPNQSGGAIHGMIFTGAEGGVEVYWGAGYGGACTTGTKPVQLAQGEVPACYGTKADGTETWDQISYEVEGGNSFSVRAYTSDAQPASHDLVLQVLATLAFMPPASPTPVPSPPAADWQTYTDPGLGFSIQFPSTWSGGWSSDLPDQAIAFTGPEGRVEVYWGGGLGGACPSGTQPVQLAQGEVPACHTTNADGTETWNQIGYEVDGGLSFSVRAYTKDAQPSSHDLVLKVLSTLIFMPPAHSDAQEALYDPASRNCSDQGGAPSVEQRGDGRWITVCTFVGQCEEWALLRGDCPAGGVNGSAYVTPAARYCAITGGQYAVTGKGGTEDEQGTCTFKDGSQCDTWDYYNGKCIPGAAPAPSPAPTPTAGATVTATQVITYMPGPPTGQPQEGNCWTNSLAVWREDAWRCMVGNGLYDPCFSSAQDVICGANPVTTTVSFALTLTQPLPTPEVPPDTAAHAWLVELADGAVCEYATGATGGVGDERINYFCPSPDPARSVVILGDLQPGYVWMAKRAVLTGNPPNPTVLESAEVPIRTVWR